MDDLIPAPIYKLMREFIDQKRSGAFTLFGSDGHFQSYEVKYGGKVPKEGVKVDTLNNEGVA